MKLMLGRIKKNGGTYIEFEGNYRDWVQAMVAYKTTKENTHTQKLIDIRNPTILRIYFFFLCSNFRYADCTFYV